MWKKWFFWCILKMVGIEKAKERDEEFRGKGMLLMMFNSNYIMVVVSIMSGVIYFLLHFLIGFANGYWFKYIDLLTSIFAKLSYHIMQHVVLHHLIFKIWIVLNLPDVSNPVETYTVSKIGSHSFLSPLIADTFVVT